MKKVCYLILAALLLSSVFSPLTVSASVPIVSASHAVLYEPSTETILFEKDKDVTAPMASTTKIMTAYLALRYGNLKDMVVIPAEACGIEGSSIYMEAGEILSLEDLVYALLLQSANDAATAIAIHVGGSQENFVKMMNDVASEMNLQNTHFDNPHGLDGDTHYTTAIDLAKLASAAMEMDLFRQIVSTVKHTIPKGNNGSVRVLLNHNKLLRMYDNATGVKTGFTKKSGRCLVGAAEKDGLTLISVTLDAPNDWNDHISLLEYGFSKLENRIICPEEAFTFALPVWGTNQQCYCTNLESASAILPKDAPAPEYTISLPHYLTAPLKRGRIVGYLHFMVKDEVVADVPLVIK